MMSSKNNAWSRRLFLSTFSMSGAAIALLNSAAAVAAKSGSTKRITIKEVASNFEREPLKRPFGFKGSYMSEKWQTAALIESGSGKRGVGLCSPSVLWADSKVFASYSEAAGNAMMYSILDYALHMIKGRSFFNPVDLLEEIFPDVYEYGKEITKNPDLRETFVLMALVALDNAAWLIYANENGFDSFDQMIPEQYRLAMSYRHDRVGSIPLFSYTLPIDEIRRTVEEGYFFLKIKIGQPGTQTEMLEKDKQCISQIHSVLKNVKTPHTQNNRLIYYLDANGRYENKSILFSLLDHIKKIGAFEQLIMIEEPFPEHLKIHVGDLGVRIIADESAHTDASAKQRIEMGYKGFAIKPAAKTLSMSLKVIRLAFEYNLPCFCADSTANPILVDWNKNVAARVAPLPGLNMGLVETNGRQNYSNWKAMKTYHPCIGASWTEEQNGIFILNDDFYRKSGGIYEKSEHYAELFKAKSP